MSEKNKKQYGVWMDSRHAMVAGKGSSDNDSFVIMGHIENPGPDPNTNEHKFNNNEIALKNKFYKEIASLMPNIDEIHVTGTGQVQEEFIHFLKDTPQYKNVIATECTTNKMGHEDFITFLEDKFK
jgi:stalled ribosome rescue protein Dom34